MSKQSKRHMGGSGEALPSGAVGEFYTVIQAQDISTTTANNYLDVDGLSVTLTPGVWLISYGLVARAIAGTNGNSRVLRNVDGAVPGSEIWINDAVAYFNCARTVCVTISQTQVVRVQIRSSSNQAGAFIAIGPVTTGGLSNPDNSGVLSAVRIA